MIKKYEWNESVVTGDPVIDLQHKQFFAVLLDFSVLLEKGEGAKGLKKMLVFLKYYGEWHFGREETSQACFNCPLACENSDAHKQYVITIDALLEDVRKEGTSDTLALSAYDKLTDWLVNHIMRIDKVNADHVKASKEQERSLS